ncbi:MAG TPA: glycosyltransferase family 9 protein [Bryobacteraceae bacterium]|nr:glycosyltransferase family 9 protein [Bryobacteraceae bacterium]
MGGLGDLVLLSQLIHSLRATYHQSRIVLACRQPFVSLPALFPSPPDETIGLTFNPYGWVVPTEQLYAELGPAIGQLKEVRASVFIAAEYQPTWFSWFVSALLRPERAIYASHTKRPRNLLPIVLDHYHLPPQEFEGPVTPKDIHENQRYQSITTYLRGQIITEPKWTLPPGVREAAFGKLATLGLASGDYLVCFPLGAAGIKVKRWPRENFCNALNTIRRHHKLPVLLTGELSEAEELSGFAGLLSTTQGAIATYVGGAAEIPMLAGLIAGARAYLGNDTGPMHLAGAYGVAGVAIYGGGHWPSYAPWGDGSVGMVHPLPCFGCNWDCLFDHGICVESIPPAAVSDALREVLLTPGKPARVQSLDLVPASSLALIQDANKVYRVAELDRGERLRSMVELQRSIEARDLRIEDLEKTAAERLEALQIQEEALEQLRKEAQRRVDGMVELTELLELRELRIEEQEQISADRLLELRRAGKLMDQLRQQLRVRIKNSSAYRAKQEELQTMEKMAEERLAALLATDQALADLRVQADRREAGMRELTAIVHARDKRIAELERTAQERLVALEALDQAYRELQAEAERRAAGLLELTRVIEERKARIAGLEQRGATNEAAGREDIQRDDWKSLEALLAAEGAMEALSAALQRASAAGEPLEAHLRAMIAGVAAQIAELESRLEQESANTAVLREKARVYESRVGELVAERKLLKSQIAVLQSEGLYHYIRRRNRDVHVDPVSPR